MPPDPEPGAPAARRRLFAALRPDWMGRNVTVLLVARIPMSAARALGGVVVPIYLALLGFSAFELGELFLTAGIASAVIAAASGTLSDRFGRRGFLIVVPAFAAAAAVVFAVTTATWALFLAAALGSFGRGSGAGAGVVGPYQPVESALVAQSTAARWRNAAFGRMGSAASVGALIGGLFALVAGNGRLSPAAAFAAYRPAFVAAAALAAAASLLGFAVREPARAGDDPERPGPPRGRPAGVVRPGLRGVRFPRRSLPLLIRLWVANSVNGVAIGMFGPFVTYWFFRRYGVGPGQLGVLFAVINALTVVSSLGAAGIARRLGLVRAVVTLRGVLALLLIPMALSPWFWLAGLIYLVRVAAQRVSLPLRQSFVFSAADPAELASVAALAMMPAQLTMSAAPLATGYLFDEVSLELPFLLSSALQMLNAVLYWVFFRSITPEEERARPPVPTAPQ